MVAGGEMLFAPTVTRRLVEAYVNGNGAAGAQTEPAPTLDALTPREREILRLVGTGYSNIEIATARTVGEVTGKPSQPHGDQAGPVLPGPGRRHCL